jgi:DNA-binding CsgD family transcriptional regulator
MKTATNELIAGRDSDLLRSRPSGETERGVRQAILRVLLLSPRELEVLSRFSAGNATREVARILQIAPRTVEAHSASIVQKLAANIGSTLSQLRFVRVFSTMKHLVR